MKYYNLKMRCVHTLLVLLNIVLLGGCKQSGPAADKIALADKTWREGIVIDEFIFDQAPRITSYNVCYTKLLRISKP